MGYFVIEKSGSISFLPSGTETAPGTEHTLWQSENDEKWGTGLIGSPALFVCICLPPPPFVPSFWAVVRRAECMMLPFWQEVRGAVPSRQGKRLADRLRGGWELLRWRRLQREAGMGSESKTTLPAILQLRKGLFLSDSAHLGTRSIRQMYLETDLGFCRREFCVLTSPHATSNSSLPPRFADTWSVLYLLCQVSHMYTKTLCKGSDFIALLQITLTRGKSDLQGN